MVLLLEADVSMASLNVDPCITCYGNFVGTLNYDLDPPKLFWMPHFPVQCNFLLRVECLSAKGKWGSMSSFLFPGDVKKRPWEHPGPSFVV